MFLRRNVVLKEECCSVLGIKLVVCHERYLRLPTVTGRDKKKSRVLLIVFGIGFKDGKRRFFLRQVKKFS